jgi:hypothetical protein
MGAFLLHQTANKIRLSNQWGSYVLAVIDSGLGLAERNVGEPEKARSLIADAHERVTRGLRLTSQLLAFPRQKELPPSVADVNALLANWELFLKCGAGSSVRIEFHEINAGIVVSLFLFDSKRRYRESGDNKNHAANSQLNSFV